MIGEVGKGEVYLYEIISKVERVMEAIRQGRARDEARLRREDETHLELMRFQVAEGDSVIVSGSGRDRGTPERRQHDEIVEEGDERGSNERHARALWPTPLDRYKARGELSKDDDLNVMLWEAGDRFRRAFYLGGLMPRMTANLEGVGGGSNGAEISDKVIDARRRYLDAARDVDVDVMPIIVHVVCLEGTVADWAKATHGPGKEARIAAMTTLRLGLRMLARHYGLLERDQSKRRKSSNFAVMG